MRGLLGLQGSSARVKCRKLESDGTNKDETVTELEKQLQVLANDALRLSVITHSNRHEIIAWFRFYLKYIE